MRVISSLFLGLALLPGGSCTSKPAEAPSVVVPDSQASSESLYERIGGDEAVHRLALAFYARVEHDAKYSRLLELHGGDLGETPQHLYEFLSQWLGGPSLYNERHGHPQLRKRHTHISIDTSAADLWLACMDETLAEVVPDETLRKELKGRFREMAYHLRNQPEASVP